MTPPLDVIGDIANPTLTEIVPTGTLTWDGVADFRDGTHSDTKTFYGYDDFTAGQLTLIWGDVSNELQNFGVGDNNSGIGHYPAGDGGAGSLYNGSDGRGGYVEERDQSGTLLSDFSAQEVSTKGVAYHPGRDTVFTANDSDSEDLREYSRGGSKQNGWSNGTANGVGCDGTFVYVHDEASTRIYKFDPSTGSVVDSWSEPAASATDLGVGWDGYHVVVADNQGSTLFLYEPDGTLVKSISIPSLGTNKNHEWAFAYGSWWVSDRDSSAVREYEPTYVTSTTGTYTTPTKSFANPATPDLQNLVYSLNGESITLDVVGSPGTASEEVVTQTLDGSTDFALSWSNSHTDFHVRCDLSTATATTTPTLETIELIG